MNSAKLCDAARQWLAEQSGAPSEEEIQVVEVQQRQGQYVAKYILLDRPRERYMEVPLEALGMEEADARE